MTDKQFKRLSRAQLMDIIYQFQLQVDDLNAQVQKLEAALEDKHLRIEKAGSLAEAALEINDCFQSAQNAAAQYLAEIREIRTNAESERAQLLEQAQAEREQILAAARAEAETIVSEAKQSQEEMEAVIKSILKEYGQGQSDNG